MTNDKNKPLKDWEGDPKYDNKDDIFEKGKKLPIDPDDIGQMENKEITFDDNPDLDLDEGLDVPGADLDDADEFIGEEDEENNYYSLGGDDHDDLEEDEDE